MNSFLRLLKKKPFFKEKKNDQKNERYTEAGNVYDTHMICCSTSHIQNTLLRSKKIFFFFFLRGGVEGGRDGGNSSYI